MGREHGETSAPTRPVGDRTASGLYPLNVALEAYDAARPRSYGAPAVLAVLAASPAAARVRRAAAGTALHAAVYGRHGDAVVLAVLRAEPAAAAVKDRRFALPVHAALETGASCAVVVALLEAWPEAAKHPCPFLLEVPLRDVNGELVPDGVGRIDQPALLVAALVLRRNAYAGARVASPHLAGLLEARSATIALLDRFPGLVRSARRPRRVLFSFRSRARRRRSGRRRRPGRRRSTSPWPSARRPSCSARSCARTRPRARRPTR